MTIEVLKLLAADILSVIPAGVTVLDADGVIIAVNPGAEQIMGIRARDVVGLRFLDIPWRSLNADGQRASRESHPAIVALQTGEAQAGHIIGFQRDRESPRISWVVVDSRPIRARGAAPDSLPSGVISTIRDITAQREAEAALRQSEARLAYALEATADGLWDWSISTDEVYYSPQYFRMVGFSPGDIQQDLPSSFSRVHPDDVIRVSAAVDRHLHGVTPTYESEHRIRTRWGGWIWVLDRGKVVSRDEQGRALRMVGTHTDITRRKATEEALRSSEERFAALAIQAPVGIFETDTEGRCIFVNDRFCQLTESTPGLAAGEGWVSLIHPDDVTAMRAEWVRSMREERGFRLEYRMRTTSGQTVWVIGAADPVRGPDGSMVGYLGSVIDITQQKRTEGALREALYSAEQASRAKSVFLSRMSHELRTPLNSIIGFSYQLLKNRSQALPAMELDWTERIHRNGQHLLTLINDILDLSKIEAGRTSLEIQLVDIGTLAGDVLSELETQVHPGVRVDHDFPAGLDPVSTDPSKLRQVLINLLGNAFKFTRAGSVAIRVIHEDRTPVAIEVRDTGIGIPRARLGVIFEPFEQGDSSVQHRFGGTGLGLAISRSLSEYLGWSLTAESDEGEGAVFTLWFRQLDADGRMKAEALAPG
ncbi:MAG: luxQ 1 [Gemmatimonadetes bacterium]|nr:luxQ 1 [Gemmatimonadota bacterium]